MAGVDSNGQELYRHTDATLTGGRLDSPDVEVLRDDMLRQYVVRNQDIAVEAQWSSQTLGN